MFTQNYKKELNTSQSSSWLAFHTIVVLKSNGVANYITGNQQTSAIKRTVTIVQWELKQTAATIHRDPRTTWYSGQYYLAGLSMWWSVCVQKTEAHGTECWGL